MCLCFISNKCFAHSWSAIISNKFIYSAHLVPYYYIVMVVICIVQVTFTLMAPRYLITKRCLNTRITSKYYHDSTSLFTRFNKNSLESEEKVIMHPFAQTWRNKSHSDIIQKFNLYNTVIMNIFKMTLSVRDISQ